MDGAEAYTQPLSFPSAVEIFAILQAAPMSAQGRHTAVDEFLQTGCCQLRRDHELLCVLVQMLHLDHEGNQDVQASLRFTASLDRVGRSFLTFCPDACKMQGQSDPEGVWDVLTDVELERAMRICVKKAPVGVIKSADSISLYLPRKIVYDICAEALCLLDWVPFQASAMRHFPFEVRLALAKRLTKDTVRENSVETIKFLVELLFDLGVSDARIFYDQRSVLFDHLDPTVIYRATWQMLEQAYKRHEEACFWGTADWLRRDFERRLQERGYVIASISGYPYSVEHGGKTYVPEWHQRRHNFESGELVIFLPQQGTYIDHNTFAVGFIPATYMDY